MRSTKKVSRPRLEMLEDRWVPATVHDVAGDLLISNPTAVSPAVLAVTVSTSATGGGQVTVKDGSASAVTYSNVGSLIEITGSNLSNTITFTGDTANFAGNLVISSGNGADTVNLIGAGANTTITNGNVTILQTIDNADNLNLNGNIGGSLTYVSTYGSDTVTTTGATTVGGNANLTGLQNLTLTSAFTVKGSLTLTNLSAGFPLDVTGAGALSVGSGGDTLDSLNVLGGAGADKFLPTGTVSVTGNAYVSFGQSVGHSQFELLDGSNVGGNLGYYGGNGGDTVTFAATDLFAGNVALDMGNGANTLNLNEAWLVAGNLTISEGNGSNVAFTVGGTVAGNETISQGNGVNGLVTISGPPAGVLTYHGGNGTDLLDLEGTATSVYNVYITFGTGTNTLDFDTVGDTGITFTGTVVGSGGANTFAQGAFPPGDTLIDISFINFP